MTFDRSKAPPLFVASAVQCRSDHPRTEDCAYRVAWSINPHMKVGTGDFRAAAVQQRSLVVALAEEGVDVLELPFVHGAFDSVFTKDAAILLSRGRDRVAVVSNPRHAERRREQRDRARTYRLFGFDTIAADGAVWEGGDVAMLPSGKRALLGWGTRSERGAAIELERRLGVEVIPLELRDPRLFHLDMALGLLPDGTALVCEEALTPAANRALYDVEGIREIVTVPTEEALRFGLNFVVARNVAVIGGHAPTVEHALRSRGFRPKVVPVHEFHLAGGSVACLLAKLHVLATESVATRPAPHAPPPSSRSL
jgi:N-dimethylarginine dimethylaminohydrolase